MLFQLFWLLLTAHMVQSCCEEPMVMAEIRKNIDLFEKILTQIILNGNKVNTVYSPARAYFTLASIVNATEGKTSEELTNVVKLLSLDCVNGYRIYLDKLEVVKNIDIKFSNEVCIKPINREETTFDSLSQNIFKFSLCTIGNDKQLFVKELNSRLLNETNGSISQIISEDDLQDSIDIIVLSVIYFNGEWKYPFIHSNSLEKSFHDVNNHIHTVKMVFLKTHELRSGFNSTLNAKFVVLPYKDENYTMIIIVPNSEKYNETLFNEVKENLKKCNYSELIESGSYNPIELAIPTFQIQSQINLRDVLTKMNVTEMFSDNANFSGLYKSENRKTLGKFVQTAFIAVDETKTNAAATAAMKNETNANTSYQSFLIDVPFLFVVTSTVHGILLEGQFTRPVLSHYHESLLKD